ncbi:hypothetical protein [Nocardia sp. NBC_01388]|uniref:hypothetical protein n=1 Tax=Nocardia sp. NBC_01388 TaxID=2903596 RepID=UPI00324C8420
MPDPAYRDPQQPRPGMFVHADGELAEYLCHAEPLGMTAQRAQQLHDLHAGHSADCLILATADQQMP